MRAGLAWFVCVNVLVIAFAKSPPATSGEALRVDSHADHDAASAVMKNTEELIVTKTLETKDSVTTVETRDSATTLEVRDWVVIALVPFLFYTCFSQRVPPVLVIICWCLSSFGMNVMNKLAATNFKATCLLVIIQMLVADAVMVVEYRKMFFEKWSDVLRWSIVPFFFAGMLCTSMIAFKMTTMSTVLILRNVLPLFSFTIEKYSFNVPAMVTTPLVLSMVVSLVGTMMYGAYNISVTSLGVVVIGCNCAITVMDRVLQRYFLASKDFTVSVPMCMIINNSVGIVPVLVFAGFLGEVNTWYATVMQASTRTWLWVLMSGLCGTCLGYLGLRCQKMISATTFLMLQNFNKISLIFFGVLTMGDQISGLSAMGCIISMLGTCWYGYVRLPTETPAVSKGDLPVAGKDSKGIEHQKDNIAKV
eukprot:gnl/TRDRNA2_/TRDRNA2_181567_c0_seq1.p1 gnl/TRDRNA2_/TRDRNA2_181567_c0~~gnl/TRDRNA2_/TRDRNA2_181567_c0_seq1.p1  ORF type:complete len:420 (+),score=74.70 gnl/TRDRNA2_/TRDRNA2_181567_c0_seq1:43-1302(+)